MKNYYKIGELAAQFGISTDMLRLYDEMGILPAHRDAANGYRLYDRSDLICLSYIRYLRRSGMTLEDIRLLMNEGSPSRALEMMQIQRQRIAEQIRELEILQAITDDYIKSIGHMQEMLGTYSLCVSPRYLLYPFVPDMEGVLDAFYAITKRRSPRLGFTVPKALLRDTDSHRRFLKDNPKHWNVKSMLVLPDYEGNLEVPEGSGIDIFPPTLCMCTSLHCILDKDYSSLARFIQYVHQQGYRITGDLHMMAVSFRNGAEQNEDYYQVWLPVEGGPCPEGKTVLY